MFIDPEAWEFRQGGGIACLCSVMPVALNDWGLVRVIWWILHSHVWCLGWDDLRTVFS